VGVIDDLDTRGGGGLLAVTLAPGFEQAHLVYTLETAAGRDGDLMFRVARYREVNGTLGDRVVLLDGIPAAPVQPRGALRFGPDGLLYAAFDDGGDEIARRDRSPYNGTLLRLNGDGTTPRDQRSPIIGQGFRSPRGLTWSPASGRLWAADMRADGSEQLVVGSTRVRLPSATGVSAVAFFRNSLIVAGAESMLRVQIAAGSEQVETVERLAGGEGLTPVRVVAVSPAGETYFATETTLGRLAR
jgi:glucose/arabinose dehydrogenase